MKEAIITDYPVNLTIDYPEGERNRLTTFFRLFLIIPIIVILTLISPDDMSTHGSECDWSYTYGGFLFLPLVLIILFRRKYPRWWFDWNLALAKFSTRVSAYCTLLRDEYPSTDEEQAVHLQINYPDVKHDLNRWLPLVKWFLGIPHYIVLFFLSIAALVVVILGWFAILFTGQFPKKWFDFVVGVQRWSLRVSAYAFLLTTDKYPPFRLSQ